MCICLNRCWMYKTKLGWTIAFKYLQKFPHKQLLEDISMCTCLHSSLPRIPYTWQNHTCLSTINNTICKYHGPNNSQDKFKIEEPKPKWFNVIGFIVEWLKFKSSKDFNNENILTPFCLFPFAERNSVKLWYLTRIADHYYVS